MSNIQIKKGYVFKTNDLDKGNGNYIFVVYMIYLKNNLNCHVKIYKRIQDVFSEIGGISQFIKFISLNIDSLYNNYIISLDTNLWLFNLISDEKNKNKKVRKHKKLDHSNKNIEKEKK